MTITGRDVDGVRAHQISRKKLTKVCFERKLLLFAIGVLVFVERIRRGTNDQCFVLTLLIEVAFGLSLAGVFRAGSTLG